jgi:S-adenosylmethionine:tRNA ribosyltransferase-isomerase
LRGAGQGHGGGDFCAEIFRAGEKKFFDFDFFQGLLAAEQVRDQGDLGEVLDGFHLHVGVFEGVAVADHAMIRHEDGIVGGHIRLKRLSQLRGAGRAVARQWNASQPHDHFAHQRLGQRDAGSSKAGGGWRVGVDDGVNVGTHAIDEQVHADFAGHAAAAGDPLTVEVDDDHVGGLHGAFADAGGGDEDAVAIQAHGEIAIHGSHEAVFVQHASITDDFFPVFAFRRHGYPWGRILKSRPQSGIGIVPARGLRKQSKFREESGTVFGELRRAARARPYNRGVLVSDFHYELPEELIAQEPLADRAGSRLLHVSSGRLEDRRFREFPELLRENDLVVFNNTRVFPARLYGRRDRMGSSSGDQNPHFSQKTREMGHPENSRGRVEVLLTRQVLEEPNEWECLVRPGKKIGVGERLIFGDQNELQAEVIGRGEFGERRIRFSPVEDFFGRVEKIGHTPLPPYIARADSSGDRERYQTVYARERGSVAAPTAGLHFTPAILGRLQERGIETAEVTLHVGLGTFQPVRTERVEEHRLHSEAFSISEEAREKIGRARRESRRIVAVGTTTVRTLEYAAQQTQNPHFSRTARARNGAPGKVRAGSGEANLFIYPGYKFQVVGALLTNFHLPQSTLLMLVCALGGKENIMQAYQHAVRQRYRFYSYGDCMLLE